MIIYGVQPEKAFQLEQAQTTTTVPAGELERALTRRLMVCSDEQDSVEIPPKYDAHWLKCPRPQNPYDTILGFAEDGYEDMTLQLDAYKLKAIIEDNDETNKCPCQAPHRVWKRTTLSASPSPSLAKENESRRVSWIDFRDSPLEFQGKAQVMRFLQSLLGNQHESSPWTLEQKGLLQSDLVLVCLDQPNSMLTDFRVSDAAPSWYLHSRSVYDSLEDTLMENLSLRPGSFNEANPGVIYVFKRIAERPLLSVNHPDASISATTGCLWETVIIGANGEESEEKQEKEESTTKEYRMVCPPYVNLEEDYSLEVVKHLFSPKALEFFKSEALRIPLWTPWPETQHYSVSTSKSAENPERPWTVFPLCYCFPANQPENLTWVESTRTFCPETCKILQKLQSDTGLLVRTALFSRLSPETTLEAHTGWADLANHVFRLHIPLVVPPGGLCGTWVDGCVETHCYGRPLIFDDSKIHRAFNYHPTESRIVLIVDLARPEQLPKGYATGGHSEELNSFIQQMSNPR